MMKKWWNSLKWREKSWLYLGIILLGGLVSFIGAFAEAMWLARAGIIIIIWDFIGYCILARCPHCRALLWRQDGDYCQYCGQPIDPPDHKGE